MEALRITLDLYDAPLVRQIAETLEFSEADLKAPKSTLIKRLLVEIPRRAASREFIQALSEADRGILALVLDRGGQIAAGDLVGTLITTGLLSPTKPTDEETTISSRLEALLRPLLLRGLLVNLTPPLDYQTRRHLQPVFEVGIAPEVASVLPRALLEVPQPDVQRFTIVPPAQVASGDPEMLVRQLFFVWSGLLRNPARQLKSGSIARADLRRLARELNMDLETQADVLHDMIALLLSARLLRFEGGNVVAADDERVQRFWQQDAGAQYRELFNAFLNVESSPAIETTMLYRLYGYGYGSYQINSYKALNQQLMAAVRPLIDVPWFSFDTLLLLLSRGKPGSFALPANLLHVMEEQLRRSMIGSGNKSLVSKMTRDLQDLDATTAVELLSHWQWLGVVDMGYQEGQSAPWAIRLTPLGRAIFRQEAFAFNGGAGQVILQPDFQLLALGPVPLGTLEGIERFADRETVQPATVGYRLTRSSIYRALQKGTSIGVICGFLRQVTQQPLPQNVERTLEEWGAQHERIMVRRNVVVLQTDTTAQLDALLADAVLQPWLQRLDEHTAVADTRYTQQIQDRLWHLELLPAVSRGPEADLSHSLIWDEGRLLPRLTPPSLYVTGIVQRFAAPEAPGWRLTAASVREAINTGYSVPDLIAQIERLTGASLSPEWQQRLKAWGSHYGSANLLQAHLLRLESAALLAEVRGADRQLSRWLHPLTPQSDVAIIDERNWEAAVARLTELGVHIEEGRWW